MKYILKHIFKRIVKFIVCTFIYLISISIVVFLFATILNSKGVEEPLRASIDILFGIASEKTALIPQNLIVAECITRDVFIVFWIGAMLSRLLSPSNPIYFSKYYTYENNTYSFRYWLMLPPHRFLYDVDIRVLVTESNKPNSGRNRMKPLWEWESSEQHLSLARGIRHVDISANNCTENASLVKLTACLENSEMEKKIRVMIRGTDKRGNTYYESKVYNPEDCAKGYQFISTLKNEYLEQSNCEISNTKRKLLPTIRYQYFGSVTNSMG